MSDTWIDHLPQFDPNMSKRAFITNITPLPSTVSRETAVELLHNHVLMIELNPLVIRHRITEPPPNSTQEEKVKCTWYEITDEVNYLPGGAAKSEMSYKGGFYDLPSGLQTHVFAPGGVDLKAIWRVGGSRPGEPPEARELGVDVPKAGLYYREDCEVRCNVFLMSFVKRNLRKSHAVLVQRLLAKANEVEASKQQQARMSLGNGTESPRPVSIGSSRRQRDDVFSREASVVSSQTSCHDTPGNQGRVDQNPTAPRPLVQSSNNHFQPYATLRGTASSQPSPAAVSRQQSESFGFGKPLPPEPPASARSHSYQTPQSFGEQAELATTTQSIERDDNWPDAPPGHEPSAPRDAAGGQVIELDNSDVAYWKQRQGVTELE